jgi:hypothetical protein
MAICWLWTVPKPRHGDIVVRKRAGGEFTVKRLLLTPRLTLQPMNAAWSPIYPDPDDLDIFGVVTHIIHRPRDVLMFALADVNSFYASCERVSARI